MSDRRVFRWAGTSARMLVGTLVAVGFVVGTVTAVAAPWPTVAREPLVVDAVPVASETVLSCVGGLLAIGRDATSAAQLSVAADQAVTAGAGEGAQAPAQTRLSASYLGGAEGAAVYTAPASGSAATDAAAAGWAAVSAEDLSGFAASECTAPLMESWLVGGASTTGASDLVLLGNPGSVAATVQLTVYGSRGAQIPPGGRNVIVPPGQQIALPLAGLSLGEESPVLRVTAAGAPVQASLQASLTRTLVPGGVDQVGATATPATDLVIAGVEVTAEPGPAGASNAATLVRMLSPSVDTTATVTVTAVGGGAPALAPSTLQLTAGLPAELQLGGLPVGQYVVDVRAPEAVLAAVWQTTGFGAGADFAWYTPAPELTGASMFAVPGGASASLTITNAARTAATVSLHAATGAFSQQVAVPAGGSVAVRLPAQGVYTLDPGGVAGVRAGLSFSGAAPGGGTALAGYPVLPVDAAAATIRVYP
ncbi:DUF5719 family protein [Microbacterium rhizomatis]|uniref:Large extracellular alpha-helical protein n=1 Tax=Microbacterium rhizomatis TaxID=1631477 RepID=A0A5J5J7V0_9MICO|nr:DUF5719 family protein [Microbacterium rhizomatis]KAA9111214.1 large extracellular alpha-helical protein [Microbacterium rhizomatis]